MLSPYDIQLLNWVSNLRVHGAVLHFLSATWGEHAKGMSLPNNWFKQGHTPEIPDYCPAKGNGQDCYVGVTVGLIGNHGMQIQLDFEAFIRQMSMGWLH